jgi:uncharacterized protein with PIN domain
MKITMICPICDSGKFTVELPELELELIAHETESVSKIEFQCPECGKLFWITG